MFLNLGMGLENSSCVTNDETIRRHEGHNLKNMSEKCRKEMIKDLRKKYESDASSIDNPFDKKIRDYLKCKNLCEGEELAILRILESKEKIGYSPPTPIKSRKKRRHSVNTSSKILKICSRAQVSKWNLRPQRNLSQNLLLKSKRKGSCRMTSFNSKLKVSTGQLGVEYVDPSSSSTVSMGASERRYSISPVARKLSFEVSSGSSPKSMNKAISSVSKLKCTVRPLKSNYCETYERSTDDHFKEQNKVLTKENMDLRKENDALKREITKLMDVVNSEKNTDLRRENTDLRKENDDLREEVIRLRADVNSDHRFEVNQSISKENFVQLNCEKCEKVFSSTAGLISHCKRKHTPIEIFKKPCNLCGKKVKQLDKHLKKRHSGLVNNVCEVCGKSFSKGFKKHRRDCIKCTRPQCKYMNAKKKILVAHIRDCKLEQTEPSV